MIIEPTVSFGSFITIDEGESSLVFTFFSLPAEAELFFEVKPFLLTLAGAEDGSFMVTPFKVSALNVEFNFKIDLIVFGPDTGSAPANFSSGGRWVLQTKDSSAEAYSVVEELVIATEGSVIFTCDSTGRILPVS
ncbi:hypothetical protein Tco_1050809 [Tanacetum coccineum]